MANPKSIFLHQELTPILGPRPNAWTNIIDYVYTKRYKKYLYYRWWAHNVPRHSWVEGSARIAKKRRFLQVTIQCKLTYIPTTWIETQYVTLQWKDFKEFYALISHNGPWFEYVQQRIPTITDFIYSWFEFKRVKRCTFSWVDVRMPKPFEAQT